MIDMLIKYGKKILLVLLVSAILLSNLPKKVYADYSENSNRQVDIVVRAGEWGNSETVKPGKRYNWGGDINISQHGISASEIPTDIPLRCEDNNWFISEFDINLKLAKAIAKKLDSKYGVDVNLQYATSPKEDLNSAGKIASKSNPKIYLSVHHNAYKDDTTGYFIMSNEGDIKSSLYAKKLSDVLKDNGKVPQRENRSNNGYIGELNHVKKENRISILGEFGYFNKAEITTIVSDEYVDYVSDKVAESLYNQLLEMKEEEIKCNMTETVEIQNEVMSIEYKDNNEVNSNENQITNNKVIGIKNKSVNKEEITNDDKNKITSIEDKNKNINEKEEIVIRIFNDQMTIENNTNGNKEEVKIQFR